MIRCAVLILLLAAGGPDSSVIGVTQAQEGSVPPEFIGVRVGLADHYKVGVWTPVVLTLRGGGEAVDGRVRVTVPDADGTPCTTTAAEETRLLPGQRFDVSLCARFGHTNSLLRAELVVDGRVVAQRTFTAADTPGEGRFPRAMAPRRLIVHVGRESAGLEEAVAADSIQGQPRAAVARIDSVEQLPAQWQGYEGVDAVVLSTSQPGLYAALAGDRARVETLDQWVRMGGKLLLTVGSEAPRVLGEGPLARFAPGRLRDVLSLNQLGTLEGYARSPSPIPRAAGGEGRLWVARLAEPRGQVEAAEADVPLVVRRPYGFGQVIFLAADLEQSPLRQWDGRRLLIARLLGMATGEQASDQTSPNRPFGFSDLAGQLRSSLDRFEGVGHVPFYVIALLLCVYLLAIGPGDYFLLRKLLGRMEWTWITFSLVVVLFSAVALVAAWWLKGDGVRVSQVDLVDFDIESGDLRGTTWASVFSPRTETYRLSIREKGREKGDGALFSRRRQATIGWFGLAGEGLGGMYQSDARAAGLTATGGDYAVSPGLETIENVTIPVWSSKSFTGRWYNSPRPLAGEGQDVRPPLPPGEGRGEGEVRATLVSPSSPHYLHVTLADQQRVPSGLIVNQLDVPLTRCILVYDQWAYDLGTIAPGGSIEIDTRTRRTELQTLLTGTRLTFDDRHTARQKQTPYDQASLDPAYILQAMMFYDAAGGQRYSGLACDYQRFVDFSGLLGAGRAVLVAQPDGQPPLGADVLRDGQSLARPDDRRTTIYRFVIPVDARKP